MAKRALGEDPSQPPAPKNSLHPQLIVRWSSWINNGLDKETKEKLLEKYEPTPKLDAHKLNPELHALSEKAKKRDSYFVNTQKIVGAALTALGLGTSPLFSNNIELNRELMLEKLLDCGKIISLLHHNQLSGRKTCIGRLIKKNLKPVIQELKSDEYIFGKDMLANIKKSTGDGKHDSIIDNIAFKTDFKKDFSKNFNYNRPHTTQYPNHRNPKSTPYKKNVPNFKNSKMQSKNIYNQNRKRMT